MVGDQNRLSGWLCRSVGKLVSFFFFRRAIETTALACCVEERGFSSSSSSPPFVIFTLSLPSSPTNHLVHFFSLLSVLSSFVCVVFFLSFSFHPVSTRCVPMGPERELMLTYLPPAAAARLCLAPSSLCIQALHQATRKY